MMQPYHDLTLGQEDFKTVQWNDVESGEEYKPFDFKGLVTKTVLLIGGNQDAPGITLLGGFTPTTLYPLVDVFGGPIELTTSGQMVIIGPYVRFIMPFKDGGSSVGSIIIGAA